MGEIGYDRREYLYELRYVDLYLIEKGYNRRLRHPWTMARWETYHMMLAQCGSDGLKKAGINSQRDLLPLPWDGQTTDTDTGDMPTAEQIEQLRRKMREENARLQQQ